MILQMIWYKEIKQLCDAKDRSVKTMGRKDKKENVSL